MPGREIHESTEAGALEFGLGPLQNGVDFILGLRQHRIDVFAGDGRRDRACV